MQEKLTIARPYAQAAFEQARDDSSIAAWSAALTRLATIVSDPDMDRVIADPRINKVRVIDLICELGDSIFSPRIRNFIRLLSEGRRLNIAPEISALFEDMKATEENVANVEVVSAFELDGSERDRIAAAIEQRLNKEIRITERIDRDLIGGAVVRVGDLVYDVSLHGGLTQLTNLFNRS